MAAQDSVSPQHVRIVVNKEIGERIVRWEKELQELKGQYDNLTEAVRQIVLKAQEIHPEALWDLVPGADDEGWELRIYVNFVTGENSWGVMDHVRLVMNEFSTLGIYPSVSSIANLKQVEAMG